MATFVHSTRCITPAMTADNAPAPVVVSCSAYSNTNSARYAFDQTIVTPWYRNSTAAPQWLKVDLGDRQESISAYTITSAGNNVSYRGAPQAFALLGSNDDTNWVTLSYESGQTNWGNAEMRTFTLAKGSAHYRYFRLDLLVKEESSYGWQIENVELLRTEFDYSLQALNGVGGVVIDWEGYRYHKFMSSGTFYLSGVLDTEILIVGGGGGGSQGQNVTGGGAGGAGGVVHRFEVLPPGVYNITVGAGGVDRANGQASTFGEFIAVGGGNGAGFVRQAASIGGSGGGGSYGYPTGAAGTAGQGYKGGDGTIGTGGGGGGAGGAGVNGTGSQGADGVGGNGGTGLYLPDFAIALPNGGYIAGGGGGGCCWDGTPGVATHGGGNGSGTGDGFAAINGTGGGGGGPRGQDTPLGGRGGDGIVVVRYPFKKSCYLHGRHDRLNMLPISNRNQVSR